MNYIPERLIFVHRNDSVVVTPEGNKGVLKTAKKLLGDKDIKETIIDNTPSSIKIEDHNWKIKGGKGWKALYNDKFLIDVEDDVLLELLKNTNINKGETAKNLIWARINGRSKLIMIDSKEYNQIIKESLKPKKEIKHINQLNELTYYRNGFEEEYLYLGLVSVVIDNVRQNFYCKIKRYNDTYYMKMELTKNPPQFVKEIKKENSTKQEVIDKIVQVANMMNTYASLKKRNNISAMKSLELPLA